jgi:hypothetical protein
MRSSAIFYLLFSILLILGILVLRPIQNLTSKDCLSAEGTVNIIDGIGGPGDIVFTLEGDGETRYYINRGKEFGLSPMALDGQYILFRYADHWTPLDPFSKTRHVAEVVLANRILYSELSIK